MLLVCYWHASRRQPGARRSWCKCKVGGPPAKTSAMADAAALPVVQPVAQPDKPEWLTAETPGTSRQQVYHPAANEVVKLVAPKRGLPHYFCKAWNIARLSPCSLLMTEGR